MLRLSRPKTDLRTLITLLAVASIVITLANSPVSYTHLTLPTTERV